MTHEQAPQPIPSPIPDQQDIPIKDAQLTERFVVWLSNMPRQRVPYIAAVALNMQYAVRLQPEENPFQEPLNLELDTTIDPLTTVSEHRFNEVAMEITCRETAQDWLNLHPESQAAEIVARDGAAAPLHQHAQLVTEMFFADQQILSVPEESIHKSFERLYAVLTLENTILNEAFFQKFILPTPIRDLVRSYKQMVGEGLALDVAYDLVREEVARAVIEAEITEEEAAALLEEWGGRLPTAAAIQEKVDTKADPENLRFTPKRLFMQWLEQMKQEKLNATDPLVAIGTASRLRYVAVFATAMTWALGLPKKNNPSLADVLSNINTPNVLISEGFSNDLLPGICIATARNWLKEHPNSRPAQIIAEQGIKAPISAHVKFVTEMFQATHPELAYEPLFEEIDPYQMTKRKVDALLRKFPDLKDLLR